MAELKNYLQGRLMLDPSLDGDELIHGFVAHGQLHRARLALFLRLRGVGDREGHGSSQGHYVLAIRVNR